MAYIGTSPSQGVRHRYLFTATSGQTTFTGSDDDSRTLSYTDTKFMDVFLNGVLLDPNSDYTATTGSSVVLTSGASAGDLLEVIAFDTFSVFSGTFGGDVTVGGAFTSQGIDDNASSTAVTIDGSGRVTMPYQPAFSASGNTNSYITTSPIVFGNVELNRNNIYNNSTGIFTAPVSGAYKFDVQVYCRCNTGENAYPRIQKSTDGGSNWISYSYAYIADQATGQVDITLNINVIMNLNANDLVRVTFNGSGDYYNGNEESKFSGFLIG